MRKQLGFLLVLVVLALALTGCAAPPTPEPTAAPQPTATLPPPTPSPLSGEACLPGTWQLNQDDLETLLAGISTFNLEPASGAFKLMIEGEDFNYISKDLVIWSIISDVQHMEAKAELSIYGDFTAEGDLLTFVTGGKSTNLYDYLMVTNGDALVLPGVTPVLVFSMPEQVHYTCAGDTLVFDTTGLTELPVVMGFFRSE